MRPGVRGRKPNSLAARQTNANGQRHRDEGMMKRALATIGAKKGVCNAQGGALRPGAIGGTVVFLLAAMYPIFAPAQDAGSPPSSVPVPQSAPAAVAGNAANTTAVNAGGTLHGVIKSGNIPLPGVA